MIKQHNGAFLLNDTAASNPAVQSAMASYMQQLKQETARHQAIREGRLPAPDDLNAIAKWGRTSTWNISDRD